MLKLIDFSAFSWIWKKPSCEDPISEVPDDILKHILSRMKLKEAVRASILSTRWRHVWNFCQGGVFHITLSDFISMHKKSLSSLSGSEEQKLKVIKLVYHVLRLHQAPTIGELIRDPLLIATIIKFTKNNSKVGSSC